MNFRVETALEPSIHLIFDSALHSFLAELTVLVVPPEQARSASASVCSVLNSFLQGVQHI
jgi:hypothetical protein